jgi:hypothetical protein
MGHEVERNDDPHDRKGMFAVQWKPGRLHRCLRLFALELTNKTITACIAPTKLKRRPPNQSDIPRILKGVGNNIAPGICPNLYEPIVGRGHLIECVELSSGAAYDDMSNLASHLGPDNKNGGTMENKTGETAASGRKAPPLIPDGLKTALLFLLVIAVGFLLYDSYRFQQANRAELNRVAEQIRILDKTGEAKISTLKGQISETQEAVGSTKLEIKKTAQQFHIEGQKTKAELSEALAAKAGMADVQAIRTEADSKIGQVSSEVGGVKNEVGTVRTDVGSVKTDLANTRRELEGTQRQLVDVKETLTAAVAKNSSELDVLRRKGERDYFEFSIPKRNQVAKVEDIQVILRKTDPKKGKFSIDIIVDDNKVEKKDRNINEPLVFLVGKSRLRYELVVNWIQKDGAGG